MSKIIMLIIGIMLLGCGPTETVTKTKVVYETEYETITEVIEVTKPCENNVTEVQYGMPSNVTIKEIVVWDNMKGLSVTRDDTNITIYLATDKDKNISEVVKSIEELKEDWFKFYEIKSSV